MARPYRLYKDEKNGKFYHLINKDGKKTRKYIKVPEGISQKQLTKININLLAPEGRRIKRKRKKPKFIYKKKIINKGMVTVPNPEGLPLYRFAPKETLYIGEKEKEEAKKNQQEFKKQILNELKENLPSREIEIETKNQAKKLKEKFVESLRGKVSNNEEKTQQKFSNLMEGARFTTPSKPLDSFSGTSPKKRSTRPLVEEIADDELIFLIQQYAIEHPSAKEISWAVVKASAGSKKKLRNQAQFKRAISEYKKTLDEVQARELFNVKEEERDDEELDDEEIREIRNTKGKGIKDGLYNDEIERITKHRFKDTLIPVIAQDEIYTLPGYLKKGAKIFGGIINTNPSTSDGSGEDGYRPGHWTSFLVDARDDHPTIEWFDPLVQDAPSKELVDTLKGIGKKMNPEKMFLFKMNQIQRQKNLSNMCGVHAIKFLEDRYQGKSWADSTGFNHYMTKIADDSKDGEKKIESVANKYKKYL